MTTSFEIAQQGFAEYLRFPKRELASADVRGIRKRVGIIGAGIAGLVCAYELERAGHQVEVFEASSRIGGRIYTHRFSDGSHGELGAMRIPSNHECVLHYVDMLKLPIRPFVNYNPHAYYLLRGRKSHLWDWSAVSRQFQLGPSEEHDPATLLESVMMSALNGLTSTERAGLFGTSLTGLAQYYDSVSLRQYLADVGLSEEAIEYLGHASGLLQYEHASFLEVLIDYLSLLRIDQLELVGGMDQIVFTLAARIKGPIHLNSRVTRVSTSSESVTLSFDARNGGCLYPVFDYVVCTVPAPAVAQINFNPCLSPQKRNAFQRLHYASAAKTLLHTSTRIWETVDGIFGGGSFSDRMFQQCWYPSDNARPTHSVGQESAATSLALTANGPASPCLFDAVSTEASHSSGVLTGSYTWEVNARRMAALPNNHKTDEVMAGLETLHPGISRLVDDVVHIAWDAEPNPGGGAFAYFAPGEHHRYHGALIEPHPQSVPRVYFAGEHVSIVHAWIQGAIRSALDSVIAVMTAPSPRQRTSSERISVQRACS